MAGGRILPTGQRLSVTEPVPGQFHWRLFSRDGSKVLLQAAESYTTFGTAKRGAMNAYKANGGYLAKVDPEPERKQIIKSRVLRQPTEKEAAEAERNKPRYEGDMF